MQKSMLGTIVGTALTATLTVGAGSAVALSGTSSDAVTVRTAAATTTTTTTAEPTSDAAAAKPGKPAKPGCAYPSGTYTLSIAAPATAAAGSTITVTGALTRNGCKVKDSVVSLYAGSGKAVVVGTDTTDAQGEYAISYVLPKGKGSTVLTAMAEGASSPSVDVKRT